MSTFTIGVFAVIFDQQNRVLLCHRRDMDIWNLPGGGMEPGELPTETAIRETREETGLDIIPKDLVGVYSKQNSNDLVFIFTAQFSGGKLTCNEEAGKIEYFAFEDLPANTIPKHVERIQDTLKNLPAPIFRCQTNPSTIEFLQQLNHNCS